MIYSCEKYISGKNPVLFIEKICTTEECDMGATPLILFNLRGMSSGRLRGIKDKGKFQTFSSKSARGCLREAVAFKRFQM